MKQLARLFVALLEAEAEKMEQEARLGDRTGDSLEDISLHDGVSIGLLRAAKLAKQYLLDDNKVYDNTYTTIGVMP